MALVEMLGQYSVSIAAEMAVRGGPASICSVIRLTISPLIVGSSLQLILFH